MRTVLGLKVAPKLARYTRASTKNEAFQAVQAVVDANLGLFDLDVRGAKKKFLEEIKRVWDVEVRTEDLITVLMEQCGWNEDWRDTFRKECKSRSVITLLWLVNTCNDMLQHNYDLLQHLPKSLCYNISLLC